MVAQNESITVSYPKWKKNISLLPGMHGFPSPYPNLEVMFNFKFNSPINMLPGEGLKITRPGRGGWGEADNFSHAISAPVGARNMLFGGEVGPNQHSLRCMFGDHRPIFCSQMTSALQSYRTFWSKVHSSSWTALEPILRQVAASRIKKLMT